MQSWNVVSKLHTYLQRLAFLEGSQDPGTNHQVVHPTERQRICISNPLIRHRLPSLVDILHSSWMPPHSRIRMLSRFAVCLSTKTPVTEQTAQKPVPMTDIRSRDQGHGPRSEVPFHGTT